MLRTSLFALASSLIVATMAATPASAQSIDQHAETRIEYADLDLGSTAGADALLNRLQTAAGQACGDRWGQMTLREHRSIRSCKRDFMRTAMRDVRSPVVAARYAERTGRPEQALILASR